MPFFNQGQCLIQACGRSADLRSGVFDSGNELHGFVSQFGILDERNEIHALLQVLRFFGEELQIWTVTAPKTKLFRQSRCICGDASSPCSKSRQRSARLFFIAQPGQDRDRCRGRPERA